ncbi:MAG: DUF2141 domain-containing protein [Parvularculaceae bacterium]
MNSMRMKSVRAMSARTTSARTTAAAGVALAALSLHMGGALADDAAPTFEHVSCEGVENEIFVTVNDVRADVGLMVADLYRNDPDGFLKSQGRVQQVRFAAKSPTTHFCFQAPTPGDYAIALYHDENANKTLDRKAFGIPAEPFGISNDPSTRFGPPSIEESLFEVAQAGATIDIQLKN